MKKLVLLLIFLTSVTFTFAQKVNLGLGASPHVSWYSLSEIDENDSSLSIESGGAKIGFAYGLIVDFNLGDNYGVSTGIYHSIVSGKTKSSQTSDINDFFHNNPEHDWKIQYVEVPVTLKMKTNEFGNGLTYFGKFGIAPQIKVAEELELEDKSEKAKFFNAYFLLGAGVHYSLDGNTALLLGLSYRNGLTKINDLDSYKVKSSYISIDIGILF